MDPHSNVIEAGTTTEVMSSALASPFAAGLRPMAAGEYGPSEEAMPRPAEMLATPFAEGLLDAGRPESDTALQALAEELADEEFDEAVQALVDEAAGRHLTAAQTWGAETTEQLADTEAESWLSGLAAEADALLAHLEQRFTDRTPESVTEDELTNAAAEALSERSSMPESEDFLKVLARKAVSFAKGAAKLAKRGVALVGRQLLGPLFGILRRLVQPLLRRVLSVALDKLPANLRQDATTLAGKLGIPVPATAPSAGAALAEMFDHQLAQTAVTDNQALADNLVAEWEDAAEEADGSPVVRLDGARAELADQISQAEPGSVLTSQVERFIPAVMAALPLIRTGIGALGRDRVVTAIATPLAQLISGYVGQDASRALARAIADKGLRLLRLEAEADPAGLGAEALVSTLEDTIGAVGRLPGESAAEPLRLRAELQEAFAEAAARHLPGEVLRADLAELEVDGESTVWVLMPRGPARRYRYRKCARVFPARITRNVARTIVVGDHGTLEQRLLDEGETRWPVEGEVHVYETLPGTHLGHLAAAEGQVDTSEFDELTVPAAALLLGQPRLGRPASGAAGSGRRYYRLDRGRRRARRRRHLPRALVVLALTGSQPVLRVHLRLSERGAHRVGELLAQHADVKLVADFRKLITGVVTRSLPASVVRQAQRTGVAVSPAQASALAAAVGEQMVTAISAQIRTLAPTLATAASDPADGVTITFEFGFADREALLAGRPNAPVISVHPGRHHG